MVRCLQKTRDKIRAEILLRDIFSSLTRHAQTPSPALKRGLTIVMAALLFLSAGEWTGTDYGSTKAAALLPYGRGS